MGDNYISNVYRRSINESFRLIVSDDEVNGLEKNIDKLVHDVKLDVKLE